jgi:hypothetical protein
VHEFVDIQVKVNKSDTVSHCDILKCVSNKLKIPVSIIIKRCMDVLLYNKIRN